MIHYIHNIICRNHNLNQHPKFSFITKYNIDQKNMET